MLGAFLLTAVLPAAGGALATVANAPVVVQKIASDIDGVALLISCDPGPIAVDYAARTASTVPLTDPYAVVRGADKGLVSLMNEGGRRATRYIIPHEAIRAIVRMTYRMDVLDAADLVFARNRLVLIHTTTTNAGIFTVSDVYELRQRRGAGVDTSILNGDPQLQFLVKTGLASYQPATKRCVRTHGP